MNKIPIYKQLSSYEDTRHFLQEVVGSFIEVNIKDNKSETIYWYDKERLNKNGLSDNSRHYCSLSAPNQHRDIGIDLIIKKMCEKRKMKDTVFFIGYGDFPIIMKDRRKHPHYDRYLGDYDGIYPTKMTKVFSRSRIDHLHDDLLFPTRDFLSLIFNREELISKTNFNFIDKKPVAVFRGSITGNDRTITNTRVQAKIMSLRYPSYLDIDLTNTFSYYMYESGVGAVLTEIDDPRIISQYPKDLDMYNQADRYKYILHIDGFTAAWRMSMEMFSMSVILKVDSEWKEHFYDLLTPWIHYIPIKSDLSDLINIIDWCRNNDKECEKIAINAFTFANKYFTEDNLFNYLDETIYDNTHEKFTCDYFKINLPLTINKIILPEVEINFDKVKYKKYLLPQKKLNDDLLEDKYFSHCLPLIKDYVFRYTDEYIQTFTEKMLNSKDFIDLCNIAKGECIVNFNNYLDNDGKTVVNIADLQEHICNVNNEYLEFKFDKENASPVKIVGDTITLESLIRENIKLKCHSIVIALNNIVITTQKKTFSGNKKGDIFIFDKLFAINNREFINTYAPDFKCLVFTMHSRKRLFKKLVEEDYELTECKDFEDAIKTLTFSKNNMAAAYYIDSFDIPITDVKKINNKNTMSINLSNIKPIQTIYNNYHFSKCDIIKLIDSSGKYEKFNCYTHANLDLVKSVKLKPNEIKIIEDYNEKPDDLIKYNFENEYVGVVGSKVLFEIILPDGDPPIGETISIKIKCIFLPSDLRSGIYYNNTFVK